ncbi:MAG: hypothetical protein ABI622_08735 [Chloroflexota bacterium]
MTAAPRLTALRELAAESEMERRDFLYESTEQLRRFLENNRQRLSEIGPIKLVDDETDYLLYHPVDGTWTTRLTYQDPADSEWYDEEQLVEAVSEVVELYNPADIYAWLMEAAANPTEHLIPADALEEAESLEEVGEPAAADWQAELPPTQQETIAAQRLWQLADAYRGQIGAQQRQLLREFTANAEEVLKRTGELTLIDEPDDGLVLRADGRFETSLDLSDLPVGSVAAEEATRPGMSIVDSRTVAEYYDPADVLQWVTDALTERYPHVDFSAVYE